jgi:DNA-binding transcriptional regulator LsrR (DeoR family)
MCEDVARKRRELAVRSVMAVAVLDYLTQDGPVRTKDVAAKFGLSRRNASSLLAHLRETDAVYSRPFSSYSNEGFVWSTEPFDDNS